MILLIIFIVFTMLLFYAWACIIVRVNQYCSTLTSVFNMYFSYLIHYLSIATSLCCSAQLRTVSSSSRHALTGVWGRSAEPESCLGLLEFRRILPRRLTVYPSIKELSDNKPRALWKFAIAAVRNDIR